MCCCKQSITNSIYSASHASDQQYYAEGDWHMPLTFPVLSLLYIYYFQTSQGTCRMDTVTYMTLLGSNELGHVSHNTLFLSSKTGPCQWLHIIRFMNKKIPNPCRNLFNSSEFQNRKMWSGNVNNKNIFPFFIFHTQMCILTMCKSSLQYLFWLLFFLSKILSSKTIRHRRVCHWSFGLFLFCGWRSRVWGCF